MRLYGAIAFVISLSGTDIFTNGFQLGHTRTVSSSSAFVGIKAPTSSSLSGRNNANRLQLNAETSDESSATDTVEQGSEDEKSGSTHVKKFKTIMAANRAEIAVRIMRAATEMNMKTVGIYGHEDRYSQHRWGANDSYELKKATKDATPISVYLDGKQIAEIAKNSGVDAIHPGYGFLSESPEFAMECEKAGVTFVGPTVENLLTFSDKTSARAAAIEAGVPVVPGSDGAMSSSEEVVEFVEGIGLPVILKAAMGGGGKGMRVVYDMDELVGAFESASSEALASFGDGSVFIERFVDRPRHIEVQILGDGTGDVVHLWERDCSIQRRHQKVVEMAPAWSLPDELRAELHNYATTLLGAAKYKNAGTVEFLVDSQMRPYFIEVNPRIQVEHTVTEEVTGVDIVQAQIRIAAGETLKEIGLTQEKIGKPRGIAIQCRVTTEDPERDFAPDTGTISLYRHSAGNGVRMDGIGYTGLEITPYFDSMIVKYTARGSSFKETVNRMKRVLQEARIRGVSTNIPFLLNVMTHPVFESGIVTTSFIDDHPELKKTSSSIWKFADDDQTSTQSSRKQEQAIRYLANLAVNGHPAELGADMTKRNLKAKSGTPATKPSLLLPNPSKIQTMEQFKNKGMRHILLEEGPAAYAKKVREHKGLLVTDTTWRDAHQSLLATRMRTDDLLHVAPYTNQALKNAFSIEMWGGATFDVAMRFLRECPWERLEKLREATPDVPFQMLLRGANAVGYTSYPDNVVHKFCKKAHEKGVDIFRVFDSLNYVENLKLGVDAAGSAGGFVEGAMSYTGDVADPSKGKYNLEYYINLADEFVKMGVHSLAIKDMAGLLTPRASEMLVAALRKEHPDIPIHVHTHDTAGSGVASMLAAANAGADVVDCAIDGMSGLTSQPSLGALVANLRGTDLDAGISQEDIGHLNSYWEGVRALYAPFESGQLSGSSDVYQHEIPGGQYTNLLFQSKQLGLTEQWTEIKQKYAQANLVLGDIPKVTPSSKVVGDLAQFMVAQNLDAIQVADEAESLPLPQSVIQYLRGEIGVPPGGFPEPLRSKVLKARGLEPVEGRPGASLEEYNFEKAADTLKKKYGENSISDSDVLSHALYPQVFIDWKEFQSVFGDLGHLPTDLFLNPMKIGDEAEFGTEDGKAFLIKLVSIQEAQADGTRSVTMLVNGEAWNMRITDQNAVTESGSAREKATGKGPGAVGSPMPGVVVGLKVKKGNKVKEGEAIATLSAMKMETVIPAAASGTVVRVLVNLGDKLEKDDLIVEIEE